jgi:hypothetical protein
MKSIDRTDPGYGDSRTAWMASRLKLAAATEIPSVVGVHRCAGDHRAHISGSAPPGHVDSSLVVLAGKGGHGPTDGPDSELADYHHG